MRYYPTKSTAFGILKTGPELQLHCHHVLSTALDLLLNTVSRYPHRPVKSLMASKSVNECLMSLMSFVRKPIPCKTDSNCSSQ